jgi:hypothetical protein
MPVEENEMPLQIGEIKTEYYRSYFGDDSSYYLPIMIDFEKGKKFRFNVWAFFLGLFWQIYHKLYLVLVFVIIFMILELNIKNQILSYLDLDKDVNYLIRLCGTK